MKDETYCNGERGEQLVAYLYDDLKPADRADLDAHLSGCASCRSEMDSLRGIRRELGRWGVPEPCAGFTPGVAPAPGRGARWTQVLTMPAWAQAAAAVLVLGVAAGFANLEVHYDQSGGLVVRTGWSHPDARLASEPAADPTPWRADLDILARQLQGELTATRAEARPAADAVDAARVHSLVTESERRQERELALRLAELARDVQAQRRADLEKIQYTLGIMESNLGAMETIGVEVMRQRQMINDLAVPASQGR